MVPLNLELLKKIECLVKAGEYESANAVAFNADGMDGFYHLWHAVQLVAERHIDAGEYQSAFEVANNTYFSPIDLLRRSMQQECERLVDDGECQFAIEVADGMGFDLAIMVEGVCWACGLDLADGHHYPDTCNRSECNDAYKKRIQKRMNNEMPRSERRQITLRVRRIEEAVLRGYVQEAVDRLHAAGDLMSCLSARDLTDKSGYTLRWGKKSASLQAPRFHEEP